MHDDLGMEEGGRVRGLGSRVQPPSSMGIATGGVLYPAQSTKTDAEPTRMQRMSTGATRRPPPLIRKHVRHTEPMFIPIAIDDYVEKHLAANPRVDRADLNYRRVGAT